MTVHEAHRLQELEEARGQLLRVFAKDGFCIAVFAWGCCSFPEEMEPQLREMGGTRSRCSGWANITSGRWIEWPKFAH